MSDQFWLTPAQLNRIKPHFPLSHGVPRVDDLRVISGIIHVIKRGLHGGTRLRTTALTRHSITALCGGAVWAFSTKYSRTLRQVKASPNSSRLTRPTSKPTAPQPACQKGDVPRRIGRTKGGLNSKLHAVCDGMGRPVVMLLSEGQMSDYKGARLIVDALPPAKHLLADRGYDADWFRDALKDKGIEPCIPPKTNRKIQIEYDKTLYKQRHKVENISANSRTGDGSQHAMTAVRNVLLGYSSLL